MPEAGMHPSELSTLPEDVRERWPVAVGRAARKAKSVLPNRDANQLVKIAQKAGTASQRVIWLQRAASAWTKPLEAVAACRRGCDHCCHISVTITAVEADLIGRHVRIKPAIPSNAIRLQSLMQQDGAVPAVEAISALAAPAPCPFLKDGACSVYEVRPMACRLLLNLDDDDLLCRLVPGQDVPVPYADASQLRTLFLMAQANTPMADIRDFFPGHR